MYLDFVTLLSVAFSVSLVMGLFMKMLWRIMPRLYKGRRGIVS